MNLIKVILIVWIYAGQHEEQSSFETAKSEAESAAESEAESEVESAAESAAESEAESGAELEAESEAELGAEYGAELVLSCYLGECRVSQKSCAETSDISCKPSIPLSSES